MVGEGKLTWYHSLRETGHREWWGNAWVVHEFAYFQKVEGHKYVPPGKAKGGGWTPGFLPNMGFDADCPSAAYEFVIESITDCAFSCPISALDLVSGQLGAGRRSTNVGSSQQRFAEWFLPLL